MLFALVGLRLEEERVTMRGSEKGGGGTIFRVSRVLGVQPQGYKESLVYASTNSDATLIRVNGLDQGNSGFNPTV